MGPFDQVTTHFPTVDAATVDSKSTDETLSWGRSGAVEASVGLGDKPQPDAPSGISADPSLTHTAMEPSDFGRPVQPVSGRGARGNSNMTDIANFPIK